MNSSLETVAWGMTTRKPYPSDISDQEWAFVVPYLALVREDAPQRTHQLREVFNGLRWVVRTGSPWRYMPHDLPPWEAVYQQTRRWLKAGVFEAMVHDLRALLRLTEGRAPEPTAAIFDSHTLRSTPERGHEADTTEPSARKVRRCTRRWTLWDTCSPCWSLRPTSRTGSR
jgi:transposase